MKAKYNIKKFWELFFKLIWFIKYENIYLPAYTNISTFVILYETNYQLVPVFRERYKTPVSITTPSPPTTRKNINVTCEFEMIFDWDVTPNAPQWQRVMIVPRRAQTPLQFPANSMSFNPKIPSDWLPTATPTIRSFVRSLTQQQEQQQSSLYRPDII